MTYLLIVNKAQIKIISKSLDIYKSIIKGELSRAAVLVAENKITRLSLANELEECFDQRVRKLKLSLIDLENKYYNKYLNILQLGSIGADLSHIKKKFIDMGYFINHKKSDSISFNVSDSDLNIINKASFLYWNLLCGNVEVIYDLISDVYTVDIELKESLINLRDLATGLADSDSVISISDKSIHRKAKWCYDICGKIDNIGSNYNSIGSLQTIKIKKNA
jgi:hypothetical protein